MKNIEIFMPGKKDAQKQEFTLELSRLLPRFSFQVEYEDDKNPYIREDLLSENTCALLIAIRRDDVPNLTVMAFNKNLPIIFFFEDTTANLTINENYFLVRLMEMKKCTIATLVQCTTNEGASRLAMRVNSYLKD
jgi:hypothetical protein